MTTEYVLLIVVAVLVTAFLLVKKFAKGKAREVALAYIKKAETMAFDNMDAKVAFMTAAAYKAIPVQYRLFIPYPVFVTGVTEIYKTVKEVVSVKDTNK